MCQYYPGGYFTSIPVILKYLSAVIKLNMAFSNLIICFEIKFAFLEVQNQKVLGPVVQSIVSLTSLSVVKILTVLVSTISSSQVFLLKKCE